MLMKFALKLPILCVNAATQLKLFKNCSFLIFLLIKSEESQIGTKKQFFLLLLKVNIIFY